MRLPGALVLLVLAAVRQRQREAARGGALQTEVLQRGAQRAARVVSVLQPSLRVLACATERVCMQNVSTHIPTVYHIPVSLPTLPILASNSPLITLMFVFFYFASTLWRFSTV